MPRRHIKEELTLDASVRPDVERRLELLRFPRHGLAAFHCAADYASLHRIRLARAARRLRPRQGAALRARLEYALSRSLHRRHLEGLERDADPTPGYPTPPTRGTPYGASLQGATLLNRRHRLSGHTLAKGPTRALGRGSAKRLPRERRGRASARVPARPRNQALGTARGAHAHVPPVVHRGYLALLPAQHRDHEPDGAPHAERDHR
jgi:hypothetical protein